jgi:hypothetical protein
MFKSILGAVLAHKQIAIAAIAISGLVVYAFPYNLLTAQADHLAINIDRDIEIPCLPYCNIDAPDDIDVEAGGIVHVQITFSLVPA